MEYLSGRTCYACEGGCQPKLLPSIADHGVGAANGGGGNDIIVDEVKSIPDAANSEPPAQHVPFISHCAPVNVSQRLKDHGPERLTIKEIRLLIEQMEGKSALPSKSANKSVHVQTLRNLLQKEESLLSNASPPGHLPPPTVSAEDAAREKATSGENRAVEHVAELSREQAMKAISITPSITGGEDKF